MSNLCEMDELVALTVLEAAGKLHAPNEDGLIVYEMNGWCTTTKQAPLTKILRAVCKLRPLYVLNNLGKAVLGLAGKHGEPRAEGAVTADDVACFKAVLGCLGSVVQLAQRFVIVDGTHVNLAQKSTTLRVGDLLYVYHPADGDDANTAIVELARQAVLELIPRILERGKALADKAKETAKKLQKKQARAERSAAKKRRMPTSLVADAAKADE